MTQIAVNPRSPLQVRRVTANCWNEAVDCNCRIVVISGQNSDKPYALDVLHEEFHKLENQKVLNNLKVCGVEFNEKHSFLSSLTI
ncbi:MAG: hypothetical protein ACRCU2_14165 [Planktothrix sp.]